MSDKQSVTTRHPERGDLDKMTKKPASVQRELAEARRIEAEALWAEVGRRRAAFAASELGQLGLSTRICTCLSWAEIYTIDELQARGPEELRKLPNMGRKSIKELGDAIGGWQYPEPVKSVDQAIDMLVAKGYRVRKVEEIMNEIEHGDPRDAAIAALEERIENLEIEKEHAWSLATRRASGQDERPTAPVFIREQCPCCHGSGKIMVQARPDTVERAKLIDPGAWSLAGSAARRAEACELAERQIRSALE